MPVFVRVLVLVLVLELVLECPLLLPMLIDKQVFLSVSLHIDFINLFYLYSFFITFIHVIFSCGKPGQ